MEISYELTATDLDARDAYFRDLVKRKLRPHLWTFQSIVEGILGGFLFVVPAMFFAMSHSWNSIIFVGYLGGIAFALTKLFAFVDKRKCRKLLEENLTSDGLITIRNTNEGIEVQSKNSTTRLKKGAVKSVANLKEHLVLQFGLFNGIVVPLRAFRDKLQVQEFVETIKKRGQA